MAQVMVPPNCQGMTLTTSGAVTAVNNIITCTALEATALVSPYQNGAGSTMVMNTANLSTGAVNLLMPSVITSITLNSVPYACTTGPDGMNYAPSVNAQDAANFQAGGRMRDPSFQLVTG